MESLNLYALAPVSLGNVTCLDLHAFPTNHSWPTHTGGLFSHTAVRVGCSLTLALGYGVNLADLCNVPPSFPSTAVHQLTLAFILIREGCCRGSGYSTQLPSFEEGQPGPSESPLICSVWAVPLQPPLGNCHLGIFRATRCFYLLNTL